MATKKKGGRSPRTSAKTKAKKRPVARKKVQPVRATSDIASVATESPSYPWSVPYEALKALNDTGLTAVMKELITAEAVLRSADISQISINSEEKAADAGCDAWSPQVPIASAWLGSRETCWQFKAGKSGEPSRLRGEVAKPVPSSTLANGGRFVLVASGSVNGVAGRRARLLVLEREAKRLRLPTDHIHVLTSESLSNWLDQHPAIAGTLLGLKGFWTLPNWKVDIRHPAGWFPSESQQAAVAQLQEALGSSSETVHIHIYGRPGVGKTRLALEACSSASWSNKVLYVPEPSQAHVLELIERVAASHAYLTLVVDEAPPNHLSTWGAAAHRANGRIRLLTIGHTRSLDATHLTEIELKPLDRDAMLKAVREWHPEMPYEQHDFIAAFSDGYIKLARLAGVALTNSPGMNVRELLRDHQIKSLMDALLGPMQGRRSLHVVAVLTSVGWDGPRAEEGKVIAERFGLNWNDVRISVREFDERMGIAPRAGDLRYISPAPLGVYLAIEAWETNHEQLERLVADLPNAEARRAYHERLAAVITSPSARKFAQEQLSLYASLDRFVNEQDVDFWAAISRSDPMTAAAQLRSALERATRAQRLGITGKAQRTLVHSVANLAWSSSAFTDATIALALLADAENQSRNNYAASAFRERFQLFLGGTETPFMDRLKAVDILLTRTEDSYRGLIIEALSLTGARRSTRMDPRPRTDSAREPEWRPGTHQEALDAINLAFDRLDRVASEGRQALQGPLAKAGRELRHLFRNRWLRDRISNLYRVIIKNYPETQSAFREELRDILNLETQHWRELPTEDVHWLESFYAELADRTPAGRLREVVSIRDDQFDVAQLDPFARALVDSPELLESEWAWLTSGSATHAWHLGEAVAGIDTSLDLLPRLLAFSRNGPDIRITAGYIHKATQNRDLDWADNLLNSLRQETPEDIRFIAELSRLCTPTAHGVERLATLAESGALPVSIAGQLVFGGWASKISHAAFERLSQVLVSRPEYHSAAVALLEYRLKQNPDEWASFEELVLELLGDTSLFKTPNMSEHHWIRLASKLVSSHTHFIARTILNAHAEHDERGWFLEHSQVAEVFSACIESNPAKVWEELRLKLETSETAIRLTYGFPSGELERLPHEEILSWVAAAPASRALLVARLVAKTLAPGSLSEKLLAANAAQADLSDEYFLAWLQGGWWGPESAHWQGIAEQLNALAKETLEPAVMDWARHAAQRFRQRAEHERKREEERQVRRR
ncbi:hypothetical protein [Corallococcus macrosporus]|uniref:hypothetical protein n=1 Tax=Corallococcus macrosporus TaxID=35 RepID=UPI000F5004F8|nr:hypothetical protein [Corallococcus macrosporus]